MGNRELLCRGSSLKSYIINEIFYSLQGEGVRTGTPNIFVRFSGCNQTCSLESHGFDCDTEFVSGRKLTLPELLEEVQKVAGTCSWIVLTGGEPGLQIDSDLIDTFHAQHFKLAIETNGSIELPPGLDWITVSPKVAEHALRQLSADEVKYVRAAGQAIPKTRIDAPHKLISPAFQGELLDRKTLEWCITLVKENPEWRLSTQLHKAWAIR